MGTGRGLPTTGPAFDLGSPIMQRRLVAAFSGLLLLTACGTSSETDTTGASTQPTTGMQTQQPRGAVSTASGPYRPGRSEERRVGKGGVRTGRSRWAPDH